MSKQKGRVTGVIAVMLFTVVAMTAAFADSNHTRQAAEPEFLPASPSATPPRDNLIAAWPSKQIGKIVGTCNTARGCQALKNACKSLPKHSYKATAADGSLGVCANTGVFYLRNSNTPNAATKQQSTKPTADLGLAAPVTTSEATVSCFGTLFCGKVKKLCAALGGSYQPTYDYMGTCHY
ncbi:MAG: hypothetical protein ABI596_17495 [Pyrinomonadaceae bacterium]